MGFFFLVFLVALLCDGGCLAFCCFLLGFFAAAAVFVVGFLWFDWLVLFVC